jgi:pimeloyl-ACP methyl ester carboxylesterase
MDLYRLYGKAPYTIALVHGGPGAPGSLKPLAENISRYYGVIEILQSKEEIDDLLLDMLIVINELDCRKIAVIGHSWGAWLSVLFAARCPEYIKKIILIGSGSFKPGYTEKINKKRINRLNYIDKVQHRILKNDMNSELDIIRETAFKKYGALMTKADSYNPIETDKEDVIEYMPDAFIKLMREVTEMRQRGELLEAVEKLRCPVYAIHGDYDSHPIKGVKQPLKKNVKDFKFIKLKKCGHNPWNEYNAVDSFYYYLYEILNNRI